jgi:hypothetical protein
MKIPQFELPNTENAFNLASETAQDGERESAERRMREQQKADSDFMKEHGALFRAEMILALLNTKVGSWPAEPINPELPFKWQTRRLADFVPIEPGLNLTASSLSLGNPFTGQVKSGWCLYSMGGACWNQRTEALFAKWKKGDVLWAKETFGVHKGCGARKFSNIGVGWICYRADGGGMCPPSLIKRWKPSIFMPRRYARIELELMADPTPQRVNEISEADAKAEGTTYPTMPFSGDPHRLSFRLLWDSIHGKYPSSFLSGPWVWKLQFKRIK